MLIGMLKETRRRRICGYAAVLRVEIMGRHGSILKIMYLKLKRKIILAAGEKRINKTKAKKEEKGKRARRFGEKGDEDTIVEKLQATGQRRRDIAATTLILPLLEARVVMSINATSSSP